MQDIGSAYPGGATEPCCTWPFGLHPAGLQAVEQLGPSQLNEAADRRLVTGASKQAVQLARLPIWVGSGA